MVATAARRRAREKPASGSGCVPDAQVRRVVPGTPLTVLACGCSQPMRPHLSSARATSCGALIAVALLVAFAAPSEGKTVKLRACLGSPAGSQQFGDGGDDGSGADDDGSAILTLEEQESEDKRRAGRRSAGIPQPFKLDRLKLQWDTWATSQVPSRLDRPP